MKKFICALLGAALTLGALPAPALYAKAAGAGQPGPGMQEIISQKKDADSDPFAFEKGSSRKLLTGTEASLPEYYDLRDHGCVTKVKVQNPYGSCWSFGAAAAAESSILDTGLAQKKGYTKDTLDLSEKQIVWFAGNPISDPSNPQNGEGAYYTRDISYMDLYDGGGFIGFVTNLYASGCGPVSEDTQTEDGEIFRYRGKRGETINTRVTWTDKETGEEKSGYRKISYSPHDDWSIPEQYRGMQDYSFKESAILPVPVTLNEEDPSKMNIDENAITAIKDEIANKHHVVTIAYTASAYLPHQPTTGKEIMSEHWAQYSPSTMGANHQVAIVGYDDNYPVENFLEGRRPEKPGAWLVKNSWGSDLEEFPNNMYRHFGCLEGQDIPNSDYQKTSEQHTGYFWLSYYDATIENIESFTFEEKDPDESIAQHDRMPVINYVDHNTTAPTRAANVFMAENSCELTDIAVFTTTPGTTADYEIYLLSPNPTGPQDGLRVCSGSETFAYGGYHKVKLNSSPIYLSRGQMYSVIVRERTPAGQYSIALGTANNGENLHGSEIRYFKSVINKNESYLYVDGAWKDLSGKKVQESLDTSGGQNCIDNFPIKAYTRPAENEGGSLDVMDEYGYTIKEAIKKKPGTKVNFIADIKGSLDDITEEPQITWTSSDESIFTVTPDETNLKAEVNIKKSGRAHLTVDAGKYGKSVIGIEGLKFRIMSAEIQDKDTKLVYTGKAKKPNPVKVTAETITEDLTTNLKKGTDYTVTYKNNVKCGRAEAVVTGIGNYYDTVINVFERLSFYIIPAKANIKSVKRSGKKLTVSFTSQKASGITGYTLYYKKKGAKSFTKKAVGASATSAVISGIDPKQTYQVKLAAYVKIKSDEPEYNVETQESYYTYTNYYGASSKTITNAPKK